MASPGMYPPPIRRHSVVGPLLLIVIGCLFLLHNFGYGLPLYTYFVKFWPLLLVAIGVVRLMEYFASRKTGHPVPRMSGGTIVLLVILVVAGVSVSAAFRAHGGVNWDSLRGNPDIDDNLLHLFGSEHTYDGELTQPMSAGGTLRIYCDRGNITVNNWDQPQLKVVYHKRIFAGSQSEADSTDKATMPQLQVQGTTLEIQGNTEGAGPKGVASDIEVYAPVKANVELTAQRGDISIAQRMGDVRLNAQHGDVTVDQVTGSVNITMRHGSLHANNVTGAVMVDGRVDDLSLDSITGPVTVTADIFGDTRLSKLENGVTIRTSRTEMQVARLDGDLTMDTGDLEGDGMQGPFSLSTKAKDVTLRNLKGDIHISDDVGDISLDSTSAAALGNLDLTTHHGDVHLQLPPKANFQYNIVTRHGDISSDFESVRTENHIGGSTASGTVGRGGIKVNVVSDTGDIQLRKSENASAAPPEPAKPEKPVQPSIAPPSKKAAEDDDVL